MKAWYVTDSQYEYGNIVFAEKRSQAILSSEAIEWNEYIDCRASRKPQFDKYAELGYVPKEELLKDGWWFECCGYKEKGTNHQRRCMTICREDDAIVIDEHVYCKDCAKDSKEESA